MELLAVGLIGAVLFLGPEDIEKYLQTQPDDQEQVIESNIQSTVDPSTQEFNNLSKQYDPLEPDSIYVEPAVDLVIVNQQESGLDDSKVDQATAKLKEITRPITTWFENIKQVNKLRADRHSFIRNKNTFD